MNRLRMIFALISLLLLTGCYAASIDTGRPPSNKVIKKSFAACWIYGLIPPKTVETAAQCPDGVSKVETQLSFVNMLVGGLTLGIYTPMQIVVTCAEPGKTGMLTPDADIVIPKGATDADVQAAFAKAADQAMRTKQPVFVRNAGLVGAPGEEGPAAP